MNKKGNAIKLTKTKRNAETSKRINNKCVHNIIIVQNQT